MVPYIKIIAIISGPALYTDIESLDRKSVKFFFFTRKSSSKLQNSSSIILWPNFGQFDRKSKIPEIPKNEHENLISLTKLRFFAE